MKRLAMILAVASLMVAVSGTAGAASFDAPSFGYTKVIDGGSTICSGASFAPDGTKIAYVDRGYGANSTSAEKASATYRIRLYDRTSGTTTTLASDTRDGNNTGLWGYTVPYFSDDGSKIGWTKAWWAGQSEAVQVYDLGTSSLTTYSPPAGAHMDNLDNSDFYGSHTDQWVAWEWDTATGQADIYMYSASGLQWVQGTNLTSTTNYKEYEPDSNRAGDKILYWSGETTAEPIDTTHTLTYDSGTDMWVKDVGFNPITYSTWAFWSRDETEIGVTNQGDLYVYDSSGNFLFDLTGPGVGQGLYSQYFGFNFATGPVGLGREYLFDSNAENTSGGRDIWIAEVIPEPAGLGLIGLALLAVRKRRS